MVQVDRQMVRPASSVAMLFQVRSTDLWATQCVFRGDGVSSRFLEAGSNRRIYLRGAPLPPPTHRCLLDSRKGGRVLESLHPFCIFMQLHCDSSLDASCPGACPCSPCACCAGVRIVCGPAGTVAASSAPHPQEPPSRRSGHRLCRTRHRAWGLGGWCGVTGLSQRGACRGDDCGLLADRAPRGAAAAG